MGSVVDVAALTFYRIIVLLILLFVLQTTVDYNLTLDSSWAK